MTHKKRRLKILQKYLITLAVLGMGITRAEAGEASLIGKWSCNQTLRTDLYDIQIESVSYLSSGHSLLTDGTVMLTVPNTNLSARYHVTLTGTWNLKGNWLHVVSQHRTIRDESQLKLIQPEQIIPANIDERVRVVSLDRHQLTFDEGAGSPKYQCLRLTR